MNDERKWEEIKDERQGKKKTIIGKKIEKGREKVNKQMTEKRKEKKKN